MAKNFLDLSGLKFLWSAITSKLSEVKALANNSIKNLSVSGKVITYTKNDGSTGTITTQDTDTHYTTHLVAGASKTATSNASATNGNVWLNILDNTTVRDAHNVVGSGATKVTTDASGNITISSTDTNTTYSAATSTTSGLMSSTDKAKLDGITSSADAVSFSRSLTSGTKVGTLTINGTGTDLYAPTNTDTHYTSKNVVGSSTATSNTTSALSNGNVYLNSVENGAVTSSHKITGSGATKVTTDASGNITISSTDTNTNTDTKVTNTLATTTKAYVTGTTSATTNTGTQVFDTGVYLDTTAGKLTATTFNGSLTGNANTASQLKTRSLTSSTTTSTGYFHIYTIEVSAAYGGVTMLVGVTDTENYFNGVFSIKLRNGSTATSMNIVSADWLSRTVSNAPNLITTYEVTDTSIIYRVYMTVVGNYRTYSLSTIHQTKSSTATLVEKNTIVTEVEGTIYRTSTGVFANELATSRSLQTNLSSTTAASFNGSANASIGVTGTLPVANGGTGATTFTSGTALIGNGTGAITTRAITNNTTKGALGWSSSVGTNLIALNTLAYWDGSYTGTSSNLTYCNKGAFGSIVTKNASDYATASHTHNYAGSSSAGGAATTALACTGNSATATKLATTRTISLTGSVTGSGLFDGSGNLSIATTTNHTHSYLPLSGGTLTMSSYYGLILKCSDANGAAIAYKNSSQSLGGAGFLSDGTFQVSSETNTNGNIFKATTTTATFPGTVTATTFSGALSGNATTATTATKLGSSTVGGTAKPIYLNAGTATACSSTVGSATKPVYMNAGTITACTYTLGKSVPSDAVFTDTVYTLPTASSSTLGGVKTTSTVTSSSGYTACPIISGVPYYKDTNTTYSAASTSAAGLMSAADKTKLDGISASADAVTFTQSLTSGTKVGTININGTDTILYAPTNTDTKVTQALASSGTSAEYPLLLAPAGQTSTATTTTNFASWLTYNPNTYTLTSSSGNFGIKSSNSSLNLSGYVVSLTSTKGSTQIVGAANVSGKLTAANIITGTLTITLSSSTTMSSSASLGSTELGFTPTASTSVVAFVRQSATPSPLYYNLNAVYYNSKIYFILTTGANAQSSVPTGTYYIDYIVTNNS